MIVLAAMDENARPQTDDHSVARRGMMEHAWRPSCSIEITHSMDGRQTDFHRYDTGSETSESDDGSIGTTFSEDAFSSEHLEQIIEFSLDWLIDSTDTDSFHGSNTSDDDGDNGCAAFVSLHPPAYTDAVTRRRRSTGESYSSSSLSGADGEDGRYTLLRLTAV